MLSARVWAMQNGLVYVRTCVHICFVCRQMLLNVWTHIFHICYIVSNRLSRESGIVASARVKGRFAARWGWLCSSKAGEIVNQWIGVIRWKIASRWEKYRETGTNIMCFVGLRLMLWETKPLHSSCSLFLPNDRHRDVALFTKLKGKIFAQRVWLVQMIIINKLHIMSSELQGFWNLKPRAYWQSNTSSKAKPVEEKKNQISAKNLLSIMCSSTCLIYSFVYTVSWKIGYSRHRVDYI